MTTSPRTHIRPVTPADVPTLLEMVRELAEYERLSRFVTATEDDYQAALFGPERHARAALAEHDGAIVGYMVWFLTFSTFSARSRLYLEDLYVRPPYRGRGIGTRMLADLAARCRAQGIARLQWQVLDWNAPSIAFYRSLGAEVSSEWLACTLEGPALAALAEKGG
jgi:GNAT superfamily N-acetyltransferase